MERRYDLLGQEGVRGGTMENLKYDLKLKGIGRHVLHMHRAGPMVKKDRCDEKQDK